MRYRAMTPEGDYVFGLGSTFLVNSPDTVRQAVLTRMRLYAGEWFLDLREGLDLAQILGYHTQGTRDQQIQQRILGTKGVKSLISYDSQVDEKTRGFTVHALIDTIYGQTTISVSF